jgi:small subunit ribosomal protein S18
MPRKNSTDKGDRRGGRRSRSSYGESRSRPKPKTDFTIDALDFKNNNLLRQFVTDQGRMLPRKYTGLPARYQRRLSKATKRARQALLMK